MLAQRKVLVLNKSMYPMDVITLEKALKKLTGTYRDGTPKAVVIDCVNGFQDWEWDDWKQLQPTEDWCPTCRIIRSKHEMTEDHKCKVCGHELGEHGMRSVNAIMRIPTIIKYTRYNKLPQQKVKYNRRTIYRRDQNTCQYCGKKKPTGELSLDHVIPRCQGGLTTWENIVVACTDCNMKKAGRTPKEAGMKLLRKPKKPSMNFLPGDIRVKDWEQFLGAAYWNTELVHDGD